ncbi:S1 RNA-binding domain-containing protein [Candidatus Gromoviella agglomerans]|uniref:S1 RNA-binding domain-containing protein n=1 Tax=Candidatus Gromoviella agglomerans TaxID=2806609 RepID=UPI001E592F0F|nr:S1 RNA-binding domain-containing protein [Candidatus Gromoviella agglomerans]UFX98222.1 30S ribosomal protein S1 [Candidatus Gromoviella agglomerans]
MLYFIENSESFSDHEENFEKMLDSSMNKMSFKEGEIISGRVTKVDDGLVYLDVGMKSLGKVPLTEFESEDIRVGMNVDVILMSIEKGDGSVGLSREEVKKSEVKKKLKSSFENGEKVLATVVGVMRNGSYTLSLSGGILAHMPSNNVEKGRPNYPLNSSIYVTIQSMDATCSKIIVSSRGAADIDKKAAKREFAKTLSEGQILRGCLVKNTTDYGAFVSLDGQGMHDGLVHVTDMSWKRVSSPASAGINVGDTIDVIILSIDRDNGNISLGVKQLSEDPWVVIGRDLKVGDSVRGKVTNIADYGVFIELLDYGIEGLAHLSELSWVSKNVAPSEVVTVGQAVMCIVLNIDTAQRRISLSLKRHSPDPRLINPEDYPFGKEIDGKVMKVTPFGLTIEAESGVRGLVHISDMSWTSDGVDLLKNYKDGDAIKVKVIGTSPEKNKLKLSLKHFTDNPYKDKASKLAVGNVVTCTVSGVLYSEVEVIIEEGIGLKGFIKRSELSMDKSQNRVDRFKLGEKIEAKIVSVRDDGSKVELSIARCEHEDHKKNMQEFASTAASSASLSDFLSDK